MRPYRKARVASVVQRIIGDAIAHRLNDPRVESLTTVTRVEMTGDLLQAKVYLSIQGGEAAERRTLGAIQHAAGYLQRMVASELPLRQCPALRFAMDERAKGVRRTMELLAENRPSLVQQEDWPGGTDVAPGQPVAPVEPFGEEGTGNPEGTTE